MNIASYTLTKTIYESQRTLVMQGNHRHKALPVIVKMLNCEYPQPDVLDKFQHEYQILQKLNDCSGVINVYEYLSLEKPPCIVMEDFGGISLDKRNFSLSIRDFLLIAIRMTQILGEIHALQVIHKDIQPANFVLNPESRQIKLIDFGIANIKLSDAEKTPVNPFLMEGTLSYISPEQTGRVNQSVDFRTDLYGLGGSFYQLLSGRPPFQSDDPLELVHCHLAKSPTPLHDAQIHDFGSYEKISPQLSKIVMKLLEKEPDNRYQSTWRLLTDLKKCKEMIKPDGTIHLFQIDPAKKINFLNLQNKLYGRSVEQKMLHEIFIRSCGKNESKNAKCRSSLLSVTGYSGIGKTILVNTLQEVVTQRGGFFIAGKHDPFQRKPYQAIVYAFNDLCRQLLTEKKALVQQWKKKIKKAIGDNARVLTEIIPELIYLISKSKDIADLPPSEAQNRLNMVFQNFVQLFCQNEHPLVLFLDDFQWADAASLKLIEILLTGIRQYFFVIIAYRDNEIQKTHPLYQTMDNIRKARIHVQELPLQPLDKEQIKVLINDSFGDQGDSTQTLSEIICQKTRGNPFFVIEFIKSLHSENLVRFDPKTGKWHQDIDAIQQTNISENVVEMIAAKISKLPHQTRHILKTAACIGRRFSTDILCILNNMSSKRLSHILQEAIIEDLIVTLNENSYKFSHDRIHRVAYSLIPEIERAKFHLDIGFQLYHHCDPENVDAALLFDIVNQMNLGDESPGFEKENQTLLTDEKRWIIANLNYMAAKQARSTLAIDQALTYINKAIQLTGQDGWQKQNKLTQNIYDAAIENAYLAGNTEEMEQILTEILANATQFVDKVRAYEIRIQSLISQNLLAEAIDIAFYVLRELGIKIPEKPGKMDMVMGFIQNKYFLLGRNPESILDLPVMTDLKMLAAMRIINLVLLPVYLTHSGLFPFLAFKGIRITLKHGLTTQSASVILSYGMLLCAVIGHIDRGYQFGQLAIQIVEKFSNRSGTWIHHMVNLLIRHWKESVNENLALILDAYQTERETGNLEYAAFSLQMYCQISFFSGKELRKLESEIRKYKQVIVDIRQIVPLRYIEQLHQVVLNVSGQSSNTFLLKGRAYDEDQMIQYHMDANDRTGLCLLYYSKQVLSYLFEDYEQALRLSMITKEYLNSVMGTAIVPCFYYFETLSMLAIYDQSTIGKQKDFLARIAINFKRIKTWAKYAPMNYEQQHLLILAEWYRVLQKDNKAGDFYDRAIESAKRNNYINELALCNKLAARFFLSRNKKRMAQIYMYESWYQYYCWGALALTQMLEKKYASLFKIHPMKTVNRIETSSETLTSSQTGKISESLDFSSVMKSMQAISSQIHLTTLLNQLIKIMIENAGARLGYVLLEKTAKWYVTAQSHVDRALNVLDEEIDFDSFADIPHEIIYYVIHTRQMVCLNDAHMEGDFTQIKYIVEKQPASILCLPICRNDQMCAVIYMENNLNSGAFTKDRLFMLELLAGQAAISIENARLYHNLDALNRAQARFVPHEFIQMLQKNSIIDVQSGDYVKKEMSVLFSDIRDFTSLSEKMSPEDNFRFINGFLSRLEPIIQEHFGFIDKFIGDAIMALFSGAPDNAVSAGIDMLKRLKTYNAHRKRRKRNPIKIGIGINTGTLMLGTVGGADRMDGTVISDSVNLASRLEGLMKIYGVPLLISNHTYERLHNPDNYCIRKLAIVKVKGKSEKITVYEVFDADSEKDKRMKKELSDTLSGGIDLFEKKKFELAREKFKFCAKKMPNDPVAIYYLKACDVANLES